MKNNASKLYTPRAAEFIRNCGFTPDAVTFVPLSYIRLEEFYREPHRKKEKFLKQRVYMFAAKVNRIRTKRGTEI